MLIKGFPMILNVQGEYKHDNQTKQTSFLNAIDDDKISFWNKILKIN